MSRKVSRVFYIVILSIFFVSCSDADILFQDTKEIENTTWNKNERVSFDFEIKDTTEFYDFYFNLRTTTAYEWANLYMFVEIESPAEKFNIDTVEFLLANSVGEWTGTSSGSIVNNKILFISQKSFPERGTYTLSFNQAMRQDDLSEIMDVGIIMKKAEVK